MKTGDIFFLPKADQDIIIGMNSRILMQDRSHFVNNHMVDKAMGLTKMNINGFGAELAFCRLAGVEFDSSTNEHQNHFIRPDCILKDGRKVDVKTTIYPDGLLLCRKGKEGVKVDLFALMTGTFPEFTFQGWASYDELIDEKNLKDLGYGEGYGLEQFFLHREL